ncbi:MAG: ribosome-associated translation inhibitor RaiA [Bacteroidetes bacterium]|nr:MAG: ribosome-associated translation inhibitor RaiA [Bacteroidota bacterium]REK08049.1 MAG: ribosome-associated translation inhibitor RaiA [Bacteroidota bacterium]REK32254.1 MAG: ribosome-associated translation inhibitor RaiA [Bacteroidota bacterium]REK47406.1 MAG: ribosome-associated translation inhibitor RaiA [Bacteroidota bacterium]
MNIIIQTPGFKGSPSLKSFVNEKLGKLQQYNDNIIRADVILNTETKSRTEKVVCMIKLSVKGKNHIVKTSSGLFEDSILKAVEALRRKIMKTKTRKLQPRKTAKKTRRVL